MSGAADSLMEADLFFMGAGCLFSFKQLLSFCVVLLQEGEVYKVYSIKGFAYVPCLSIITIER
jgi:hypothetical protein